MIEWRLDYSGTRHRSHESRGAASRFHGINHPRCASFPTRSVGLFSVFYDLAGGLLSTFSKARCRALWQIMHDFSDLPPAKLVFFLEFRQSWQMSIDIVNFFLITQDYDGLGSIVTPWQFECQCQCSTQIIADCGRVKFPVIKNMFLLKKNK